MRYTLLKIILTLLVSGIYSFAAQLAFDDFSSGLNGWSGTGVSVVNEEMLIERDSTATKTYSFSSAYKNTQVILDLDIRTEGGWENGWIFQDFFYIYANNTLVGTYSYTDGTYHITVSLYTDANAELKLELRVDSTANSEVAYIDNISIKTPEPSITIYDAAQPEGDSGQTTISFNVTIDPAPTGTVTVDYSTQDGTATVADNDYVAKSGTLTFDNTNTSRTIDITINGDTVIENDELFYINLSNVTGEGVIADSQATGTILDDDGTDYNNGERDFELRNPVDTRNIVGNITPIGNTVQCVTVSSNSFDAECTTNPDATANNYFTKYLDIDNNATTFNSTSATLNIPAGSEIVWAGLYWQGFLHSCNTYTNDYCRYRDGDTIVVTSDNIDLSTQTLDANKILFSIPNIQTSGYKEIVADHLDFSYYSSAYGTIYSAFADVTNELNTTNPNGVYTAANIQSMEGMRGYGNYGAWALFVIYTYNGEKFRNISVFDGFKVTHNETETINISGFYTPTSGPIDSKLITFAGEGENLYKPDYVTVDGNYVSNDDSPYDNVFNSTISGFTHDPSLQNNNGIDIDIFDTSSFMTNGQQSTVVKIISEGDAFYPNVLTFSTELYQPKICYLETLYDSNGNEITSESTISVGDTIHARLTIRNDDNEIAEDVKIMKIFDQNITSYNENTTLVQNIGETSPILQTDTIGDDLVDYNTTGKTLTIRIGTGANSVNGGTFNPNDTAYIDFNTTVNTDQPFSFSYQTSYIFNIAGQQFTFDGPLPKCVDFNNTISPYYPAAGTFNVVNKNYSGETVPLDYQDSVNSLYTQISGKEFHVKAVKLKDDLVTPEEYDGIVRLSLINTPDFSTAATDDEKNQICKAATSLFEKDLIFDDDEYVDTNITYDAASKNLTFRINFLKNQYDKPIDWYCTDKTYNCIWGMLTSRVYTQPQYIGQCTGVYDPAYCPCADVCNPGVGGASENQASKECIDCVFGSEIAGSVCARDNFSIRPETYSMDMNETNLIGAKWYTLDINATLYNLDTNTTGYSQTIDGSADKNATTQLVVPTGCSLPTDKELVSTTIAFTNGQTTNTLFRYMNVGDVNLSVHDKDWTEVDQVTKSDGTWDCIEASSSNTPDSLGKVGCLIEGSKIFKFNPKEFRNSLDLSNNNDQNFTYISNDSAMSAEIKIDIKAILDDNSTATNYTANCFSKDINYTVTLINDKNLTWSTSQDRIVYFDNNSTATLINTNNEKADYNTSQSVFKSGTASISIQFNFDRNLSIPDEPFKISKNDFNITVKETDGNTTGADFNRTIDQNATFIFGRVHAPDYKTDQDSLNAVIYYEVYCKTCTKSNYPGIFGNESFDDVFWYVNLQHNSPSEGNVTAFTPTISTNITVSPGNTTTVNNGTENQTFTYNGSSYPYKDRIDMNASSWLIYNRFDPTANVNSFYIEFTGKPKDWAGIGSTGKTVDLNISQDSERRIDW
ncbi:Calx-beta domain-containing protein [Nitrosophilus alvini]|uniref:Calx-beta domain-containing protein n=1 Tax=Nitrosophilus alvini TaxID=2714855 RepID=UPI00190D86A0|nr:Calx-beta domain-containing protein [Nitrosophilus alvini]